MGILFVLFFQKYDSLLNAFVLACLMGPQGQIPPVSVQQCIAGLIAGIWNCWSGIEVINLLLLLMLAAIVMARSSRGFCGDESL